MWLSWNDLTAEEQEQARESYISIREMEEERERNECTAEYPDPINGDLVMECRFERQADGYIYVDL